MGDQLSCSSRPMAIRVHYVLLVLCALEASFWIVSGADSVRTAEIEPHMAHRLDNTKAIHQPDSNCTEPPPTATEKAVPEFPKAELPPQIPSAASQKSGNNQHHSPHQSLPQDGIPSQTPQEDGFNQVFNQIKSGSAGPLHLLCGFICALSLLGVLPDRPGTYRRGLAPVLLAAGAVAGRKTLGLMLTAIVNGDQAAVDAVVLFLNPLELELKYWMGLLPVHFLSKLGLDESVDLVFRLLYKAKFLESRDAENPGKKGYQVLNSTDYIFLAINAVIEYVYTYHVGIFAWESPLISWGTPTLLDTLPALVLMFVVDDLVYAPLHRFMHWRPVYWLVHKHHHKQTHPVRGYFDAANESPMEQVLGLSCVWITLQVVPRITGLHAGTLLGFFVLYAATAMLNHTAYDIKLWFGFTYASGAHEMHHKLCNINYGQNFMLWDVLMGTYKSYKP